MDRFLLLVIAIVLIFHTTLAQNSTTAESIVSKNLEAICQKCVCNNKTKLLNCSKIRNFKWFTTDEFKLIEDNGIKFEELRLERNNIKYIPVLPKLSIKRLILRNNLIESIENEAFKELTNLELLDLYDNKLTTKLLQPKVFASKYNPTEYLPMENLRELNLGMNQLHSIHQDLFEHFPNLEILSLSKNNFKILDHVSTIAISNVINLKSLDLSFMELTSLPDYIFHSPRDLEVLNLTGNFLTSIPNTLGLTNNLKELYLDENYIEMLGGENVFPKMQSLKTLSMCYMPVLIAIGKRALSGLENLEVLKLSNSPHLSFIHPNALSRPHKDDVEDDYPPIKKIYIHNNNLTVLNKTLLARWDKVDVIDIRKNPWKCNAENEFLLHILYPEIREKTPSLQKELICGPGDHFNQKFEDIYTNKRALRFPDRYGNRPQRDSAILIGMVLGLLVGITLTFASIYMYRRGCFGLVGNPAPGAYSRAFYKKAEQNENFYI